MGVKVNRFGTWPVQNREGIQDFTLRCGFYSKTLTDLTVLKSEFCKKQLKIFNGSHFGSSHQLSALKSVSDTLPNEVKFLKFGSKCHFFNRLCLLGGLPSLTPKMTNNL